MELNAKKLRFIMARKEVGVRELAEKAGISAAAVSRYTRGITKPSIKSLGKIANALDVEVEEIIEDEKGNGNGSSPDPAQDRSDPQKGNGYKGFQRDDQRNRNDDLL